ncbi:nucleoside triphosphate pyrophosphohydrolase [Phototrophicus methaneseepsis]|uniref:Nucleoside triphosphate pyrophosphohydrolase n=1 Tax=Phototrophicus methaneseepsis TaxID=2710758 RepID=A0A7S8EDH4_9CHLR|nr:nucleoside triphosphate pyrophosphohydrolase [Phototrophicus methaneseepsis]QPC84829.1 nucleoside triphosphate pyrophosphohydrolase [Phototrophicus methaneseepsis]
MTLTIVGLGPGYVDDITRHAWRILEQAQIVYLRTSRLDCVNDLPNSAQYQNFDSLYETGDSLSSIDDAILARLIDAVQQGDVVYAVPGDPLIDETLTRRLQQQAAERDFDIRIVKGISLVQPVLDAVKIPAGDGLQIVDGLLLAQMHHPPINPQFPALVSRVALNVAESVKHTLLNQYPGDFLVTLVQGDRAEVQCLPLHKIDKSPYLSPWTTLFVPSLGEYTSYEAFQEIIAHLRAPEGCPWDRKQTHESLRPYLLEEAYEVLDAIDKGQTDELAGELGDLLLQILLHTQIATEAGEFMMSDVLDQVNRKMIRRHPHVWGTVDVDGDPDQVTQNWEDIKKKEKAANGESWKGLLDSVPGAGPALWVAHKYQHKVAKVGFDWPDVSGVEDKIREELQEILEAPDNEEKAKEIGDLMFVMVNWLRWLGVEDPESLMRTNNLKFYNRFSYIEKQAAAQGRELADMTLEEMDVLWDEGKAKGL